ncbi:MAG: hypothetical protein KatS3mg100_002 [Candidatus Parcubacteria bacterium]|nr:MAG: hypothetical protein KatS3mg100_002 [Candidatus Parcubacteria bacterium]
MEKLIETRSNKRTRGQKYKRGTRQEIDNNTVYHLNPLLLVSLQKRKTESEWSCLATARQQPLTVKNWRMLALLGMLKERFSVTQLWRRCSSFIPDKATLVKILELLEHHDIIRREPFPESAQGKQWKSYGWDAAFLYHFATRDSPFVDASKWDRYKKEDNERMRQYAQKTPPPPPYTQIAHTILSHPISYDLSDRVSSDETAKNLRERGSKREQILFSLNFCFGQKGRRLFPPQGYTLKKTIPSGGARHPTEAFVVSFQDSFLPEGVYHYNVQRNSLDLYRSGNFLEYVCRATYDLCSKFPQPPFGMLILVSEVERAMWRYRDDRSFRAILIDAGVAMMMFRILSQYFSVRSYSYQKFCDSSITELLQVDPIRQIPLYTVALV